MNYSTLGNYIVNLANNEEIYFYYDNNGICYKEKDNEDAESKILLKDGNMDFSIDVVGNSIHLVCSDKESNFIYLNYEQGKWSKYLILKSKNKDVKPQNFNILVVNNWINVFYILPHENQLLLVHHIINKQNSTPYVIDYLVKSNSTYIVKKDAFENIYIFYYDSKKATTYGYKKYDWSKKSWLEYTIIFTEDIIVLNPDILIDGENKCHIAFVQKLGSNIRISYACFNEPYREPVEKISVIKKNARLTYIPTLIKIKDIMYITWKTQLNIYGCFIDSNNKKWSDPSTHSPKNNIEYYNYINEIIRNQKDIFCSSCYGYEYNGIYLYPISDYMNKYEKKNIPIKNPIKGPVYYNENASNTNITDKNDFEKIKISQSLIDVELKKLNKKITDLENKLKTVIEINKKDDSEK